MITLLEKINSEKRKAVRLSDVATVVPGFAFKSSDFVDDGVPVVKITEIQSPYVNFDKCAHVDISKYPKNKLDKFYLHKGEYVVAMTGATIGKVGKIVTDTSAVLNQRVAVIRPKPDVIREFVEMQISSNTFQRYIKRIASGSSAQANISGDDIGDFEISIPEPFTQKKIADIVSTYDAKIENNNIIVKNLEMIAQIVFDEWFIKFRFPGFEKVKFIKSETGEIPNDWAIGKISDEANIVMGQSPESHYYNENKEGLPFHQGVTYFGELYPENVIYSTFGEKKAELGDILVSVRAPVGRINIASAKTIIGRGLSAVRSKTGNQSYLLYLLKNLFHKENLFGSGSVFPAINKKEFEELLVIFPKREIKEMFEQKISLIDKKIKENIEENIMLKSMRNQLLAKLI